MAQYVPNFQNPHKEELINLINNDNADTIVTLLQVSDVTFEGERATTPADSGITRKFAVTLKDVNNAQNTVEVYFDKIDLTTLVQLSVEDFNWYDPDTWDPETSPAAAINMLKQKATAANVDLDKIVDNLTVARSYDAESAHFQVVFSFESFVLQTGAKYQMPKHLSEVITKTDLDGFIYQPIPAK